MPIYTYMCTSCNVESALLVKIEDRNNQECSVCSKKLERKIDAPGMVWSPTRNGGHSF